MNGATYEQRKRAIFEFLYREPHGLLHRYAVPLHLSDDAIRDEVNDLVDEINETIPSRTTSEDLDALLTDLRANVRRLHGARGWPPPKVFLAAGEAAVAAMRRRAAAKALAEIGAQERDHYVITARRMAKGDAVGDRLLWGREATELVRRGLVSEATLEAYRRGAEMARQAVYGPAILGSS